MLVDRSVCHLSLCKKEMDLFCCSPRCSFLQFSVSCHLDGLYAFLSRSIIISMRVVLQHPRRIRWRWVRNKALLILVAVVVAFSGIILANRPVQQEPKVAYGPLLSPAEVRDPAIATQYGIRGYVVVSTAKDTASSLSVKKGTSKSMPSRRMIVPHWHRRST